MGLCSLLQPVVDIDVREGGMHSTHCIQLSTIDFVFNFATWEAQYLAAISASITSTTTTSIAAAAVTLDVNRARSCKSSVVVVVDYGNRPASCQIKLRRKRVEASQLARRLL